MEHHIRDPENNRDIEIIHVPEDSNINFNNMVK